MFATLAEDYLKVMKQLYGMDHGHWVKADLYTQQPSTNNLSLVKNLTQSIYRSMTNVGEQSSPHRQSPHLIHVILT